MVVGNHARVKVKSKKKKCLIYEVNKVVTNAQ